MTPPAFPTTWPAVSASTTFAAWPKPPREWRIPPDRDWRQSSGRRLPRRERSRVRTATASRVEAVLFVADGPLTANRIARHAMLPSAAEVKQQIAWLNQTYELSGTPFRIERVAAGYRLLTISEVSPWLDKLHKRADRLKLSSPALETLVITAYRQPCTRADVEAIRGVQSTEMLKYLMERGLIRIGGEDDSLGRPYLYETTKQFLELFGLRSLNDLPRAAELRPQKESVPEPQDQEAVD